MNTNKPNLNTNNTDDISNNTFINSIKIPKDTDMDKLLKIQEEIEKSGINKTNIYELTKDLTQDQKQKLVNLYKKQIKEYEISIQKYKNKIISIRKNLK